MTSSQEYYYGRPNRDGLPQLWTRGFVSFVVLNVFIFLGFDVLLPTLTLFLEDHGHSRDAIGRIFSFFMIAAIAMRALAPKLAAKFRPFSLVRLGLLAAALSTAGYFWAHSAPAASLARFGHGLGFGIASTLLTAMASQIIPVSKMAQGMGFLGLGTILTLALGPSLGVWLKDNLGYLPMFLAVCAFYGCALLWTFKMPDLALSEKQAGDPVPTDTPSSSARPPAFTLLSRMVWAQSLMMMLTGVSISSAAIYLALYFKELGLPWSGLFFGLSTIGIVVSRLFAGRIHDRWGHRLVILPALVCQLLAVTLLIRIQGPAALTASAVLWGLANGAIFPSVQALTFLSAPKDRRTEAASSLFNAFDLGMGAGSIVFGLLAEAAQSYRAVYWGAAVNCLLFMAFYVFHYGVFRSGAKAAKQA
jgi:MFS family permease